MKLLFLVKDLFSQISALQWLQISIDSNAMDTSQLVSGKSVISTRPPSILWDVLWPNSPSHSVDPGRYHKWHAFPLGTIARRQTRIIFCRDEYEDPPPRNISDKNQVFGGCFVYLSLYAVNQAQVMEINWIFEQTFWILFGKFWNIFWSNIVGSTRFKDCSPFLHSNVLRLPSGFRCFFI